MCTYVALPPALANKLRSPSIPHSSVSASAANDRRGEVDVVGYLAGGVSPLLIVPTAVVREQVLGDGFNDVRHQFHSPCMLERPAQNFVQKCGSCWSRLAFRQP